MWSAQLRNLSGYLAGPSYKECFVSGNYEAWHFRGGLVTEFLRMMPLEGVQDLLVSALPEVPTSAIFEVRPYASGDREAVYEIARRCTISKAEEELPSDVASEREIVGERTVGAFLSLSEDFCFVTEDTGGNVCGYAVGAISCSKFSSTVRDNCSDNKKLIPWLEHHNGEMCNDGTTKLEDTGLIRVEMAPDLGEDSLEACRRLLACLFSALRTVGVTTVHCPFSAEDDIDLYRRLGFTELHNCMTRVIAVPLNPQ